MAEISPMEDCEIWPGRALQAVFAQHLARLGRPPTIDELLNFGFEDQLRYFFEENASVIPVLNDRPLAKLPRSCLVRVRAMVQSVADPEFYHLVYEEHQSQRPIVKRTGKYVENTIPPSYLQYRYDRSTIQERLPAYLIPYPCETKWARQKSYPSAPSSKIDEPLPMIDSTLPQVLNRGKRGREEYQMGAMATSDISRELHTPLETPANVAAAEQHRLDDLDNENLVMPSNPTKSNGTEISARTSHRLAETPNLPVPDNFGYPVWAKFYPPHEIKPNDLVDCLGILSEPPSALATNDDPFELEEVPVPDAPRFHVVLMEHTGEGHPLVPNNAEEREARRLEAFSNLLATRESMIRWMTAVLGGDSLAAEYLLLNLISRPTFRDGDQVTRGHVPLNFIVPAEDEAQPAYHHKRDWTASVRTRIEYLLETLCSRRYTLELTTSLFDSRNLVPYLSVSSGRLESGLLQLPSGTHLLVDETQVEDLLNRPDSKPKLEEVSCFIHNQVVHYDAVSYKLPFQVDCPVIVLSQGRSIFEVTCAIPLQCQLDTPAPPAVDENQLDVWRALVGFLRLAEWPGQDERVLDAIEDDFVNIRRLQGNDYLTEELFSHWNVIARAHTISHGQDMLSESAWKYIKDLEAGRLERL